MHEKEPKDLSWVWTKDSADKPNQYVEFRHEFELDEIQPDAKIFISADTNYVVWINDKFVGTGQFSDFPDNKTYSAIGIANQLRKTKNVLAILVHYCGVDHFSYIKGIPGLFYKIQCGRDFISSGLNVLCRISPAYRQDLMPRRTRQMGFTFEYNGAKDDGWKEINYSPEDDWQIPEFQNRVEPKPRPLAMLEVKNSCLSKVIAQGHFKRANKELSIVAELMQSDFLSARRNYEIFSEAESSGEFLVWPLTIQKQNLIEKGVYLVVDLGREECGLISLDISAPSGTILDIAVGEHLEDLRVRSSINGRNFASRYICREGKQQFTHYMDRYAGRYMQLHISPTKGDIKLHHFGIIPLEYPLQVRGAFICPDRLTGNIYDTSCRTLHLCMHEHYEDCPWREQALYANDSRNQALAGYYAFGEYDFPRVSWELLGQGLRKDGYLEMCAPANIPVTIPSFTMMWFLALDDYLLYSGDIDFVNKHFFQLRRMMDRYLATSNDGLLPSPKGERFWHFYDWAEGLDGYGPVAPCSGGLKGLRFDAPLNFLFFLALKAAARIGLVCGDNFIFDKYNRQAELVERSIHKKFWSETEKAYKTYVGEQALDNHFVELTQALALLTEIYPVETADEMRHRLIKENNGLIKTSLSQSFYKFEAVLQGKDDHGKYVFEKICNDWGKMLYSGSTSFWETLKGQSDFDYAGSLQCHGWSAMPAYFYQAYLLGVSPLKNGFKEFSLNPVVNVVDRAGGKVPTPHGAIEVNWRREGRKIIGTVKHPSPIRPVLKTENKKIEWQVEVKEESVSNAT